MKNKIYDDLTVAMKSKDKNLVLVLRAVLNEISYYEMNQRKNVTDLDVISLITKMIKQRSESLMMYEAYNRDDLAFIEKYEISVLEKYLPQKLTEEEHKTLVEEAIFLTQASKPSDIGKVMKYVKEKNTGNIDMTLVSKLTKEVLS